MSFDFSSIKKFFQRSDNANIQSTEISGDGNTVNQIFISSSDSNIKREILSQSQSPLASSNQLLSIERDQDSDNSSEINRIIEIREVADGGNAKVALELFDKLKSEQNYSAGYAAFRLHFNIGIVQQNIGEHDAASKSLRMAQEFAADDPKACSGLALAELIDGNHDIAFELAENVVVQDGDHQVLAMCVLLQTAKRLKREISELNSELIKEGNVVAAHLEYLQELEPDIFKHSLEQARQKDQSNKAVATLWALSVLDNARENQAFLLGAKMPNNFEEQIAEAASILKQDLETSLKQSPPNKLLLPSQANNAALALRLSGDVMDAARLIDNTLASCPELIDDLAQLRAVLLLQEDKDEEAFELVKNLKEAHDLQIMASEIEGKAGRITDAVSRIDEVLSANLASGLRKQALSTKARIGINSLSQSVADEALEEIEATYPNSIESILLKSAYDRAFVLHLENGEFEKLPAEKDDASSELKKLESSLSNSANWSFFEVLQAADELLARGQFRACADLLHDKVGYGRESPALSTLCDAVLRGLLGSLAAKISSALAPEVKNSVFGWKFDANVATLTGEIAKAVPLTRKLFERNPTSLAALEWFVQSLLRVDNKDKIKRLIDALDDHQLTGTIEEKCEYVKLLVFCGELKRGRDYAYRLFCENQNNPITWMALSSSVLALGKPQDAEKELDQTVVDNNATFDVTKPNGEVETFTIEVVEELFSLRDGNIGIDHPIAKAALGKSASDTFDWPIGKSGGKGTITSVKHKALAAFHHVLKRFEERFPDAPGFTSVPVNVDREDGLDEMMAMLQQRNNYSRDRAKAYHEGSYPLYILAFHLGIDPIDAFLGLKTECGYPVKVSSCTIPAQDAAAQSLVSACQKGVVADAVVCYLIRRLKLEDVIKEEFGPIGITQATLDVFAQRLQEAENASFFDDESGMKKTGSIAARDGRIVLSEYSEEEVNEKIELIRSDLNWLKSDCTLVASKAKIDPSDSVLKFWQQAGGRFFDDLFAADGTGRILVSEDFHLRQWAESLFDIKAVWLQALLYHLEEREKLPRSTVVSHTIHLCQVGEEALTTNADRLLAAAEMFAANDLTEQEFNAYCRLLGQAGAEMRSHASVALSAIIGLWKIKSLASVKEKSTSVILRNLTRLQGENTRPLLNAVHEVISDSRIRTYLAGWRKGHFLN